MKEVLARLLMVPRKVLVMLLLVSHWSLSSGHSDRVPAVDGGPVGEVEDDEEDGEDAEEDEISSGEPVRPTVAQCTIQVLRVTEYNLPAPPTRPRPRYRSSKTRSVLAPRPAPS